MRIGMFAWESLHSIAVGGVAVHVTELAAALQRRGHEVHVFTRASGPGPGYQEIHGVRYHYCPFRLSGNFIEEIQDMCRSFAHFHHQTECVTGAFDIVHAHDWLASNAAVWISQAKGRRMILTMHSTEYGRCGNRFYAGPSARIRDHERHGTYCAHRVISVSQALRGELMWMYNCPDWKVRAIYNGVNYRRFDGWIDPWPVKRAYGVGMLDPMVLFVGRMSTQKGPDVLVEAIPGLLKHFGNAKFVIVGDGDMRWSVERRAHQIGAGHATRFLGARGGEELVNLYKACDVVCVPSRNEPFGIVILEAWSAGKPVAATVHGGPSEFVWHEVNGLKIYAHPHSVGWGVGNMLRDLEWARWMGRNGRIAVERAFSWDTIAEQTERVYAE